MEADDAALRVESDRDIDGDWSRLQQAFETFFPNAVKRGGSDEGGAGVEIRGLEPSGK
ncbi:hypothetical protein [Halorubrum sp. BV1]|uniref:hypothetical protein n=1 Tax=Halorubrum sp. BV1 TaxID=1498500 RepID=UPI000ABE188A|nr:hypothetical protein [Halorubrum sp. BV1]